MLWPPDAKSQITGKDPDAVKDWGQEEKGMTEDEMVGWHHQLNRHESEQLWEIVRDREVRHAAIHGVAKSRTRLSDWTTTLSEDISYQDLRDVLFLFSIYFCLFIWSQLWRAGLFTVAWGLLQLGHIGSVVVAQGLSRPAACEILVPGPRIKPEFPELEVRFLNHWIL